jgi:uncharacterized membrane protein YhiD involved in acid resistance
MPEQLFDPGSPDFVARTMTLTHVLTILVRLLCALALGSLIAYRPWRRLPGNRSAAPQPDTAQAQTIIAVAGALLVIVIGDSLARAFGLVGLGTFIRFRAGIKDPRDVAVLFMMIGIGMACGLGLLGVAIVGTLFVGCILALFDRYGRAPRRRLTLSVIAPDPAAIREVVLQKYPDARVVDVRSATPERPERTSFVIPTNDDEDALAIYQTLREKGATDIRAVRVEEQE